MTRILLSSVVSLLLTVAVSPAQSGGSAGVFSRQPYLQMATPTTVTVVWRTRTPITPEGRVGLKAGAAVVTVPAA